eukprot:5451361-Pyramimonas_sp.AAC.1
MFGVTSERPGAGRKQHGLLASPPKQINRTHIHGNTRAGLNPVAPARVSTQCEHVRARGSVTIAIRLKPRA